MRFRKWLLIIRLVPAAVQMIVAIINLRHVRVG